ncbi:MAG: 50S ribosomal protein L13 [Lentisphaerae bacterium]|jgi:large subunit ribosomal protein L13|nr:50S ribosomal protein L13 [Lentisphaerota bacterium]
MKSFLPKDPGTDREWILVDVAGKPLGRAAVLIANTLRGKMKPTFTPAVDIGDFVIVINADKVKLTGSKENKKIYERYSGYRGGRRTFTAAAVRERHPERLIEQAVKGMLPGNHLCRRMMTRLKIYAGPEHPHQAQQPRTVELG